jgi:MFS family permease
MLIMGRLFSGLGCWAGVLSSSVYASELAPATRRGDLAGLIGPGTTAGYLVAGWLSVGFFYVDSAINFRIALILQVFFPLCQLIGLPFVVESPRWLSFQGRNDEALAILVRIHRNRADPESLVAKEEAYQIKVQAERDLSLPHGWVRLLFGCISRLT